MAQGRGEWIILFHLFVLGKKDGKATPLTPKTSLKITRISVLYIIIIKNFSIIIIKNLVLVYYIM